jgi:hypothetical protein
MALDWNRIESTGKMMCQQQTSTKDLELIASFCAVGTNINQRSCSHCILLCRWSGVWSLDWRRAYYDRILSLLSRERTSIAYSSTSPSHFYHDQGTTSGDALPVPEVRLCLLSPMPTWQRQPHKPNCIRRHGRPAPPQLLLRLRRGRHGTPYSSRG